MPVAARLNLWCTTIRPSPTWNGNLAGSIDVHNDGSPELGSFFSGTTRAVVDVLIGPGGTTVRTSMSCSSGTIERATIAFDVVVDRVMGAVTNVYEPACSPGAPTLAVTPTTRRTAVIDVGGLVPTGIGALLVGFARTRAVLPCGGCVLATDAPLPILLVPDAAGTSRVELPVWPSSSPALPVVAHVQAIAVDLWSGPCRLAASDALAVMFVP